MRNAIFAVILSYYTVTRSFWQFDDVSTAVMGFIIFCVIWMVLLESVTEQCQRIRRQLRKRNFRRTQTIKHQI